MTSRASCVISDSTTLAGRQISGAAFIWAQLFAGKEQKLKGLCRRWGTVI